MPRNSPLRARLPRLPRLPGGGALSRPAGYSGAVRIPRVRLNQDSFRPYPPMPSGWVGPLSEWIIFDYFVRVKKWELNVDFWKQVALPFASNVKGFTRADYVLKNGLLGKGTAPGQWRAIVLDGLNPFTHKDASRDRLKFQVFARYGYLLVWINTSELERNPRRVIENAIRGIDTSFRKFHS